MKIRIGFLHNKSIIKAKFIGEFFIEGENCFAKQNIKDDEVFDFRIRKSIPAEYEWYEKLDTAYDVKKLESHRDKYYLEGKSTRVIKVGKDIGSRSNFEYWILKKTQNMDGKVYPSGDYKFKKIIKKEAQGLISFCGKEYQNKIRIIPKNEKSKFLIEGVSVGIDFHWDHKEDLEYMGELEILIDNYGNLTAVNIIDLEEYLSSVNSSEMRNDNNIEMLKAQTVAARSTVLATMGKHHFSDGFDLCSDDHCQCYQGINKMSELSKKVTDETKGEVLIFDSCFVDARYSKICGGVTERYSTCWEDADFPYLASFYDNSDGAEIQHKLSEQSSENFIKDKDFECFCNTNKYSLPDSLQFCKDLFRWGSEISFSGVNENLTKKFGLNCGKVLDMKILSRGYSGRIDRLEVIGSEKNFIISKELNIRRLLSPTHLPSSAFIIERTDFGFKLTGAGWGHGVGLCQIGAQVMGEQGYGYIKILRHYYRGAIVKKIL